MKQRSLSDLALYQTDQSCQLGDDQLLRRSSSSRLRRILNRQTHPMQSQNFLSDRLQEHLYKMPLIRPIAPLVVEPASSSSEEEVPSPILLATGNSLLFLGLSNVSAVSTIITEQSRGGISRKMVHSESENGNHLWRTSSMPVLDLDFVDSDSESKAKTRTSKRRISKSVQKFFVSTLGLNQSHQLISERKHSKSSNGNVKSTPATPSDEQKTVNASAATGQQEPSPAHAFSKLDKHAIKQLSTSTPSMTHAQTPSRASAEPGLAGAQLGARGPGDVSDTSRAPNQSPPPPQLIQLVGSSKARQKKFHRHFKQVAIEERVLNYYSCALVGDILLQGHLYITKNYFAFYSNVFGYVTKLLIPTVDVLKVSKEKTAKIIPNAVGISTEDEKHVFGSLLSRDSTYNLMVQVWKAATDPVVELKAPIALKHDVEDSASGEMLLDDESSVSGSGNEDRLGTTTKLPVVTSPETFKKLLPKARKGGSISIPLSTKYSSKEYWSKSTSLLLLSTVLLVTLFMSAAFLLYRVAKIQESFSDFPLATTSEDIYEEILKWQSTLHSRSAHEVHEFVNANLNQIAKVRLSLEALSMLIVTNEKPYERPSQSKNAQPDGSKVS